MTGLLTVETVISISSIYEVLHIIQKPEKLSVPHQFPEPIGNPINKLLKSYFVVKCGEYSDVGFTRFRRVGEPIGKLSFRCDIEQGVVARANSSRV